MKNYLLNPKQDCFTLKNSFIKPVISIDKLSNLDYNQGKSLSKKG